MRQLFCPLILLFLVSAVYAQTYDLIINASGDSIACKIDSLSDTEIHFRMKIKGNWISTKMDKSQVVEYQYNTINKNSFVFRPGTSIILRMKEDEDGSISTLPKNSVWLGIMTINYGRMIPAEPVGLSLSLGLSMIDGFSGVFLQFEPTLLIGGPKHFFEPGIFYFTDYNDNIFLIRTGYRYQGKNGFLFRISPLFSLFDSELVVLPSLCIGYSF